MIGLGLISESKIALYRVDNAPRFQVAQSLLVAVVKTKWAQREGRLSHKNGVMMPSPEGVTIERKLCHLTYRDISRAKSIPPGHYEA